ncbi:ATP-binding cassette domain-containing protein [Candidatus Acetothermia bacterium]|jgi:ABC-2 type transport system ATP-binding protein|nr:ATP-binding cassette domain-containing protein [Candidatus Acetothermia bacterium]MCI2427900.1 ATP-binding cassette domain-containing protein [Candidatus Acetothermia bacterium]
MAQTNDPLLRVKSIRKRFNSVEAVKDISLVAYPGEILGLLGPNGAGKTTAIRMIMGIIQPDQGEIIFRANGRFGPLNRARIGYLPEERGLYADAKVLDTLIYFAELKGIASGEARRCALEWLDKLNLTDWARHKISKLSKGMAQKVQFVASILHKPDLVLFDEPFTGLDPVNQDLFQGFFRQLRDEGMAILLSSHQMNLVEALCDSIFLINKGEQVLYGDLSEIKEAHGESLIRLRCRGDCSFLQTSPLVKDLTFSENEVYFKLPQGVKPRQFLRTIPEDLAIEEITIKRPPLHDIFVSTVTRSN